MHQPDQNKIDRTVEACYNQMELRRTQRGHEPLAFQDDLPGAQSSAAQNPVQEPAHGWLPA